jgi:hypothetical protein
VTSGKNLSKAVALATISGIVAKGKSGPLSNSLRPNRLYEGRYGGLEELRLGHQADGGRDCGLRSGGDVHVFQERASLMGMFETTGKDTGQPRKENTLRKLERMRTTLSHREPDQVPISDFFWGGFIRR